MIKTLTLCLAAVIMVLVNPLNTSAQTVYPTINPIDVTIARDSFGIPHIFAKTDAQVAYGLAWANSEDAFEYVQNLVCIAKMCNGRKDGVDGAKADFFVHAIGARQLVYERFDKDLSEDFKKYLDGYVQGVNAYAKAHPEQVKVKKVFPVTAQDVVVGYIAIMSSLCHAQGNVASALGGEYDNVVVNYLKELEKPVGSNAFALSATRTVDGKTYLCVNPHMQMQGQLSFYEAQLNSEEGLNIEGCMFQGSTSLAMGVNNNLGWGMTWNHFDRVDVYRLKMPPKKKLMYEFDGQWVKLEKRPVWLKVGLGKNHKLVLPVKKMTYWSKYGCTLKSDKADEYYAIRFPGNMSIMTGQELYEMNKATNYDEFMKAINHQAIALFNIVYADKENNIYYVHHGMLPDRKDQSFDWSGILPGNTSKTLWTGFVPYSKMQHVLNPTCGYVYNTNNTPYHATCEGENFKRGTLPDYADGRPGDNMRAARLNDYFNSTPKFDFATFKKMKFDVTFPTHGAFIESLQPLFDLKEEKYPDLKEAINILKTWNRSTDVHEYAPTLLGLVINDMFNKYHMDDASFIMGFKTSEDEMAKELRMACDTLKSYFGTVKVEWGTVNRNIRGNVDLPMRGFADMLSPCYPSRVPGNTLKYKAEYGDTFIMLAKFGKNGVEQLEALQPQGNSLDPKSPHYNDQMELFSKQQTRTVTLNKEKELKRAERVYHPQ